MRTLSVCLTAVCLAFSLTACDERLTAPSVDVLAISSPWKLQSMERSETGLVHAPDSERFTLEFSEQGRIAVVADCNRCAGSYTIRADTVSMPVLACTRAFCATAPFDTDYVTVLNGDSTVALYGATLQLSSARGTLRFAK